jgi:nanoRNase/pAp phosphatase (c-di-AMP/oligoRNAs hydrolase)
MFSKDKEWDLNDSLRTNPKRYAMQMERNRLIMEHPFPKSISLAERYKRLLEVVNPEDTLAILINADPDSIASALALKRLFWRKVKKTIIYHINIIKRADNLAFLKLLKIDYRHIRDLDVSAITKWAIVDSQPHHDEHFSKYPYDIIIDHHPLGPRSVGQFVDIKEDYGANSTIMTEYLRAAKIKPSHRLATALCYGIRTDTDNFARPSTPNDVNAFSYLFQFTNINIIKKIESSELTRKTLGYFKMALEDLTFVKDKAIIYMGKLNDPDILVIIADFFMKMAEISWCIVAGVYGQRLIVIFRSVGLRRDAGKMAQKLFADLGSAGGHKSAARAEIPLTEIMKTAGESFDLKQYIMQKVKGIS